MRYAVLADIHGNLQALRAALAAATREDVDGFLVLGDLVGYGANPNECVELVASLDPTTVAGNHDLIAIGRLSDERCIPLARESLRWTARILAPSVREYLETLPLTAAAAHRTVLAHGTLEDPQAYTASPGQAARQLEQLHRTRADAALLLLGHTHRPLAHSRGRGRLAPSGSVRLDEGDLTLINPGAVGQSREPRLRGRLVILDWGARSADFIRFGYDTAGARVALKRAGLSPRGLHLRPGPRRLAGYARTESAQLRRRLSGRAA